MIRDPRRLAGRLAAAGVATVVGLNVLYPLGGESVRALLSVVTVPVFAATSLAAAFATGGARTAVTVLLAGGGTGLVAELVGVATGRPFGTYSYADSLGPKLAGVPLLVPLAWVMMTWPAWVVGAAVSRAADGTVRRRVAWPVAAWALASWDLFLDPQMVAAGHWSWRTGSGLATALPGVPGIPVSNLLGWVGVSLVVCGTLALARAPAGPDGPGSAPPGGAAGAAWLWAWVGGVVANAVFLGRPAVALVGGVAMGVVGVPVVRRWLARLRDEVPGRPPESGAVAGGSAARATGP